MIRWAKINIAGLGAARDIKKGKLNLFLDIISFSSYSVSWRWKYMCYVMFLISDRMYYNLSLRIGSFLEFGFVYIKKFSGLNVQWNFCLLYKLGIVGTNKEQMFFFLSNNYNKLCKSLDLPSHSRELNKTFLEYTLRNISCRCLLQ